MTDGGNRDGRGRLGRWFASTGAPPTWRTLFTVLVGAVLAGGIGLLVFRVDRPAAVAIAAVTGGLVAAAGANAPRGVEVRLAAGVSVVVVVFGLLAAAVSGHVVPAALAMALVAVFTSVGVGASPVGAAFGLLATLGYVVTVLLVGLAPVGSRSPGSAMVAGALLGAGAGLLVAAGAAVRARSPGSPAPDSVPLAAPWRSMWRSVRTLDEHARDGLRRALPLGVFVGAYELTGSHDVLWAFLAALVVLLPTAKSPVRLAASRVVGTIVGVAVLLPLSDLLPTAALVVGAVPLVLVGSAYKARYPVQGDAAIAMGAIIMIGAPAGAIADFAARRLLDTVVGAAIALASMYLLWPRDHPDGGAVEGPQEAVTRNGEDNG